MEKNIQIIQSEADKLQTEIEKVSDKENINSLKEKLSEQKIKLNVGQQENYNLRNQLSVQQKEKQLKKEKRVKDMEALIMGNFILSSVLTLFLMIHNKKALKECRDALIDCWDNLSWIGSKFLYDKVKLIITEKIHVNEIATLIITILICMLIISSILLLLLWALRLLYKKIPFPAKSSNEKIFSLYISADIALLSFVGCLLFYDGIKVWIPNLNIFWTCLTFTIIGEIIWNSKDIVKELI